MHQNTILRINNIKDPIKKAKILFEDSLQTNNEQEKISLLTQFIELIQENPDNTPLRKVYNMENRNILKVLFDFDNTSKFNFNSYFNSLKVLQELDSDHFNFSKIKNYFLNYVKFINITPTEQVTNLFLNDLLLNTEELNYIATKDLTNPENENKIEAILEAFNSRSERENYLSMFNKMINLYSGDISFTTIDLAIDNYINNLQSIIELPQFYHLRDKINLFIEDVKMTKYLSFNQYAVVEEELLLKQIKNKQIDIKNPIISRQFLVNPIFLDDCINKEENFLQILSNKELTSKILTRNNNTIPRTLRNNFLMQAIKLDNQQAIEYLCLKINEKNKNFENLISEEFNEKIFYHKIIKEGKYNHLLNDNQEFVNTIKNKFTSLTIQVNDLFEQSLKTNLVEEKQQILTNLVAIVNKNDLMLTQKFDYKNDASIGQHLNLVNLFSHLSSLHSTADFMSYMDSLKILATEAKFDIININDSYNSYLVCNEENISQLEPYQNITIAFFLNNEVLKAKLSLCSQAAKQYLNNFLNLINISNIKTLYSNSGNKELIDSILNNSIEQLNKITQKEMEKEFYKAYIARAVQAIEQINLVKNIKAKEIKELNQNEMLPILKEIKANNIDLNNKTIQNKILLSTTLINACMENEEIFLKILEDESLTSKILNGNNGNLPNYVRNNFLLQALRTESRRLVMVNNKEVSKANNKQAIKYLCSQINNRNKQFENLILNNPENIKLFNDKLLYNQAYIDNKVVLETLASNNPDFINALKQARIEENQQIILQQQQQLQQLQQQDKEFFQQTSICLSDNK